MHPYIQQMHISRREHVRLCLSINVSVSTSPATTIRPGTVRCRARATPTYLSQVVSGVQSQGVLE